MSELSIDSTVVSSYNCIGGEIMQKEYVTTNIRIPREMWWTLKEKAIHDGKSLAQLLREGAMCILEGKKIKKFEFRNDPFFKIVGKVTGTKDGSIKHDRDIYGDKDFC